MYETHLLIPVIPRLCYDRLERCELFVRHGERAEEVLLEERGAGEAEEERARERLPAERLALRERGLVHRVRRRRVRMLRVRVCMRVRRRRVRT